jgi:hypothetical protein
MTRRSLLLGLTMLAALVPPADARAVTVTCGQLVTTSITVDNDLTNCPGKGLIVGADDITIDLGGRTIDGDEDPLGQFDRESDGVDVRDHDGVTVRNGRITGFADGVQLGSPGGPASGNLVIEIAFAGNFYGAKEQPGDHNIIAFNSGGSYTLESGGASELAFNRGGTIRVRSDANRLEHNDVQQIVTDGDRTYIAQNAVNGFGLFVGGSDSIVEFNRVVGGEFGISLSGSRNVVRRNLVLGARFIGLYLRGVNSSELPGPVPRGNILLNNTVSRGAGDGILVERRMCDAFTCAEAAADTVLRHNRTRYNAGDGIRVEVPSATLARNIARHNGDLGIEAVAGVTDGGENRAALNGNPAQCAGVACSP